MATLSRQLLAQNSLGVENFVRDSLLASIGSAIDKGALSGDGLAEPLGILNNANTNQVEFGAAATRAKALAFQDALTADNVGNTPDASLGYVTSFAVASKWQQIAEVATGPGVLPPVASLGVLFEILRRSRCFRASRATHRQLPRFFSRGSRACADVRRALMLSRQQSE